MQPILVSGAGPGGLVAALAMESRGIPVVLLERSPELRTAGAGLIVQPNALAMLGALGLLEDVREAGVVIQIGAIEDLQGTVLSEMPLGTLSPGFPAVAIARPTLAELLASRLGARTLRVGSGVVGLDQDEGGVSVDLEDGTTLRGAALIGADGIHSRVREHIAGPGGLRYSGYTCWRGLTEVAHPVGPGRSVERWGPGLRFGIVPVSAARTYWFATANAAPAGQDGRDVTAELLERYAGFAEPTATLIRATAPEAVLRNDIVDLEPLGHWTDGRVTLLGDAAHAMTPNMGQGACQAIEDGVVLASLLDPTDIPGSLQAYESRRRPRARSFVDRSWTAGRLGQWESGLARAVRDTLTRWTPRRVVERALLDAWTVDVPHLAPWSG